VPSNPAPRELEISNRILKHWHEAVPDDRLAHLVKDTTRSFLRSLQARLAQHDVSLGHWGFLRILWQRDGLTQRELSYEAGVMETTTLIALRGMESLGYITRERAEGNRKNNYVYLTRMGKKLKTVLIPLAEEVNTIATHGIKETELAIVRRCLLTMTNNLACDPMVVPQDHAEKVNSPAKTKRRPPKTAP
jgi:DNA-binding MarR family transcriptional regulator